MHRVAPIWRVAALMIPLASAAGCDWLPVRRRIDPSLYPVPTRPDAAFLRAPRGGGAPGAEAGGPIAVAGRVEDRTAFPPLPELRPVAPEEALASTAPTPLLDAGLVRAEAIRSAIFSDDDDATEADPASPEPVDPAEAAELAPERVPTPESAPEPSDEPPPPPGAEAIAVPPVPEGWPGDRAPDPGNRAADPGRSSPDDAAIEPEPPVPPIEPSPRPDPIPTDEAGQEAHPIAPSEPAGPTVRLGDDGDGGPLPDSRRRVVRPRAEAETGPGAADPTLWQTVMDLLAESASAAEGSSAPSDPGPSAPSAAPLRVARVAFCREILGFGRITGLDAEALRAGQDVLIYCELDGVRYAADREGHVSRLSSRLEVVDPAGGAVLWSNVLPIEDRCSRPRHDYYVGYRLTLPGTLTPGRYRLRVSQHDLISGQEAVGDAPFAVVSGGR